MAKTEQLDKKLIAATFSIPVASSAGLMITPPPIPHIDPRTEAAKLIKTNR